MTNPHFNLGSPHAWNIQLAQQMRDEAPHRRWDLISEWVDELVPHISSGRIAGGVVVDTIQEMARRYPEIGKLSELDGLIAPVEEAQRRWEENGGGAHQEPGGVPPEIEERGGPPIGEPRRANDDWQLPDIGLVQEIKIPAPTFPWNAVPSCLHDVLRNAAADCGCPVDYTFANLVVVGIVGNVRRASPHGGWIEPPQLWAANIGFPSSNKTPAITPFKNAVGVIEKKLLPEFLERKRLYEARVVQAKFVRKHWEKETKEAIDNDQPLPPMPDAAEEPEPPQPTRLMIADATAQEVQHLLVHNPRGIAIIRSELAGWLGSFDKYNQGAGDDRAFYLESWDGGSYHVDRVKDRAKGGMFIPYNSLAATGAIQPERLAELFKDVDDGFTSRLLYIYPDPIAPQRIHPGRRGCVATLVEIFERLHQLKWSKDSDGRDVPLLIQLDDVAGDLLHQVRLRGYESDKQGHGAGFMAHWRGKNPGRFLRIALVLEYLVWATDTIDGSRSVENEAVVITGEIAEYVVKYLAYAEAMTERSLRELSRSEAQRDVGTIARLILVKRLTVINEREIYQAKGFHKLRERDHRVAVFGELQRAGWIRPAVKVGSKAGTWDVNPRLYEIKEQAA